MAVPKVNEADFGARVKRCLSIAPIRSHENLVGRDEKLEMIARALATPGRSVFIYGDRGVGKTSLAMTSANMMAPGGDPILVGCDETATFTSIFETAVRRMSSLTKSGRNLVDPKRSDSIAPAMIECIENGDFGRYTSHNDLIDMLRYLSQFFSEVPVVIVDEFNELKIASEKKRFADFAKQLTDQSAPIRLIFCGVGSSMEELMGLHVSIGRSIMPIELERLDDASLWSIMDHASAVIGLTIDRETVLRTAILSDGFPYFVHLVSEYMFWEAFNSEAVRSGITVDDFGKAVSSAIPHADTLLRASYEKATKKYRHTEEYQEILWAYADAPTLSRQSQDVFEKSYLRIAKARNVLRLSRDENEHAILTKEKFDQRLAKLKTQAHDEILRWRGAGWYEFRENMMRGFVRIMAKEHGIDLGVDHHHANNSAKQLSHLLKGK